MLTERIEMWLRDYQESLAALAEAESMHAHAVYALALAKAETEKRIREAVGGKRATESAISTAVTLETDVQTCEYDVLDAAHALVELQRRVEALEGQRTVLSWLVSLETHQPFSAAA